jgi:predicted metalloprotease with PDZ domain
VQPYEWAGFLDTRLRQPGQKPPLGGIEKGGYRLVFKDVPNIFEKERATEDGSFDMTYSLGMTVNKTGKVTGVIWDGLAFQNGIVNDSQIVAVNDVTYSKEKMEEAIKLAKDGKTPIRLLIERDKRYRTAEILYSGGLRYPHLEPVSKESQLLDRLLTARRK